jgi:hypothetical protein
MRPKKYDCRIRSECNGCFPGFALVQLQDGQKKHMWELQVGDIIQVGRNEYSPIYMFSHQSPKEFSNFVRISTSSNDSIVLTPNHLLFVNDVLTEASQAKLQDKVALADGTRAIIVKIDYESGYFGLYNPHTLNGNIVVEGVVASAYTSSYPLSLAKSLLWPVRVAYSFGLTSIGEWASLLISL